MDFFKVVAKKTQRGNFAIYPEFIVSKSKDIMIRGKSFYAIWDEVKGLWSTDEDDVRRLVDKELFEVYDQYKESYLGNIDLRLMSNYDSGVWTKFNKYVKESVNNYHDLDSKIVFQNTEVRKKDYVSKRLGYAIGEGRCDAWDELIGTLYADDERRKLEWAIGSVITGDSQTIQKFIVLYGETGTGKSTVLEIIQKLFEGYYTTFEAEALVNSNNQFALEMFKNNPLVAIQHDGNLSKIETNTKLNSVVSHEKMEVNEKFKPKYMMQFRSLLFMGTNDGVRITNGRSGMIRRLIDTRPTGKLVRRERYDELMQAIDFELGAIAWRCLQVFNSLGKRYYNNYRPEEMMYQTDPFFNFVEHHYFTFKNMEYVLGKQAFDMYKAYNDEYGFEFRKPMSTFREELKAYFKEFNVTEKVDGVQLRSVYRGFRVEKFNGLHKEEEEGIKESAESGWLDLKEQESLLDKVWEDCPAQYSNEEGKPLSKWDNVTTVLKDLDTSKEHYVRGPKTHIFIDLDLKNEKGEKDYELNKKRANQFPPTYAELSKGGNGIHLHYIYSGNISLLSRVIEPDVEIKVFVGKSPCRRRLSKCNDLGVAEISSGLPLKEGEKMVNFKAVEDEKHLRALIAKALKKEVHPNTKSNIDFIDDVLKKAYAKGVGYDVTDLRPKILAFANNSTNQSEYCVRLVAKMKFKSEEAAIQGVDVEDSPMVIFDTEVFPNLFVVCWKFYGEGKEVVKMINPTPQEIGELLKLKLVGFNCRRYDNHVLYAAYIGRSVKEIYEISNRLINEEGRNGTFAEAYNLSYTDIFDFSSDKWSLKKFEIELGLHHKELNFPWDQPVSEDKWPLVVEYCVNDVLATEAVFNSRKADWTARQILAELSGLSVNDTTQNHTAKIIFGNDKNPQSKFNYVDLSVEFPGYKYEAGKSSYRGDDPSEGGYVYTKPGVYGNVALLDVASMHPTTIRQLNYFGPYTKRYADLVDARLFIKHGEFDKVAQMLDGVLTKYIGTKEEADKLAYALKIHALNVVYGLTAAKFDNKFRHPRNVDNIIAKRPALFMIDLKHALYEKWGFGKNPGYELIHIKTDSVKLADATPESIKFVMDFGKKYGYTFEHEATYDKLCLFNKACYVCKDIKDGKWHGTGEPIIHPFIFKTLFSKELITFEDLCEAKSVKTKLFLDFNEGMEDDQHNYEFIGKVGRFVPVKEGCGGGLLKREKNGKYDSANGALGYRWKEATIVKELGLEDQIDMSYYRKLVDDVIQDIDQYADVDWFISDKPYDKNDNEILPF